MYIAYQTNKMRRSRLYVFDNTVRRGIKGGVTYDTVSMLTLPETLPYGGFHPKQRGGSLPPLTKTSATSVNILCLGVSDCWVMRRGTRVELLAGKKNYSCFLFSPKQMVSLVVLRWYTACQGSNRGLYGKSHAAWQNSYSMTKVM